LNPLDLSNSGFVRKQGVLHLPYKLLISLADIPNTLG
jgi:hypothetical protein